jgi:hypothetical protein
VAISSTVRLQARVNVFGNVECSMKEIGYRENVKAKESVDTVARTTQTLTIKASGNQI